MTRRPKLFEFFSFFIHFRSNTSRSKFMLPLTNGWVTIIRCCSVIRHNRPCPWPLNESTYLLEEMLLCQRDSIISCLAWVCWILSSFSFPPLHETLEKGRRWMRLGIPFTAIVGNCIFGEIGTLVYRLEILLEQVSLSAGYFLRSGLYCHFC